MLIPKPSLGLVLAFGIGLLGAALPALRAARLSPTEAFPENISTVMGAQTLHCSDACDSYDASGGV